MPVEGENESSPTVHQQTTDIIREWLMTKFEDVTGGDSQTLFFFSAHFGDRRERLELKFSRDFLVNPRNIRECQHICRMRSCRFSLRIQETN